MKKGRLIKRYLVSTEDIGSPVLFTSKEVVDRDGDILRASGVDFSNYMKNPVFLIIPQFKGVSAWKSYKVLGRRKRSKSNRLFPDT